MNTQQLIELCHQWDVMDVLTEHKHAALDLETLAIHTQASVVSVAVVTLGNLWKEYDSIIAYETHKNDPGVGQEPPVIDTSILYAEWGTHARELAMTKKCVARKDTLDWWGKQSAKVQEAFYSEDNTWTQDLVTIGTALQECERVWVYHPHFDIPIWDHWCEIHVLPSGIHYRAPQDAATLFNEVRQVPRVVPHQSHHALFDTLAMGLQVELCILHKALVQKIAYHHLKLEITK